MAHMKSLYGGCVWDVTDAAVTLKKLYKLKNQEKYGLSFQLFKDVKMM